jgi:sigma-B regulation protein RsbU (phosphoserine phosphatase)
LEKRGGENHRAPFLIGALAALPVVAQIGLVVLEIVAAGPRLPFQIGSFGVVTATVEQVEGAPRRGDRLLGLNGERVDGYADVHRIVEGLAPGTEVAVRASRAGAELDLRTTIAAPVQPRGVALVVNAALIGTARLAIPLLCLGLGLFLLWAKPHDRLARVVYWLFLAFALLSVGLTGLDLAPLGPSFGTIVGALTAFASVTWAAPMLIFALGFPDRLEFDRRRPWLKWLLLTPTFIGGFVQAWQALAMVSFDLSALMRSSIAGRARLFGEITTFISIGCFFALLGWRGGTTTQLDARRRLHLLLYGAGTAMAPGAVVAATAILRNQPLQQAVPDWFRLIAFVGILMFPVLLAYVIVVHKAMDVKVALRLGLQYALAQRAVRFVQVVIGAAVAWGVVDLLADSGGRRVDQLRGLGIGVLALALVQRGARSLQAWLDRRFFREAVDTEHLLAELGERVRTIVDRRELLATVSKRLSEALHVPRVAAFVKGENGFAPAFATGYDGGAIDVAFGGADVLTCCVAALDKPQTVYLDDARSWVRRENIPESDVAKLRGLSSEVLIPLRTKNAVEGFLSLGPKSSEAAYSPTDLRLLQSVASQTALALDNARLTEQVASEVARRERMNREIEIAREVQMGLFPRELPKIAGLDLAGHCRPAQGVGGDYYDFIALRNGRLGFAIGDIAGKGIPAALLMAGLQAGLRGQALAATADLPSLMSNVNRLIFESSPQNRYATFFYGEYDPQTRVIRFVNAGHNAPMILRATGAVDRLNAGGPVIGLLEDAPFVEDSAMLHRGDMLVGFTDGISECMNVEDEEWGEDALIAALREAPSTSVAVVDHVLRAADAFAAGAKQHDDMTLIVIRASIRAAE